MVSFEPKTPIVVLYLALVMMSCQCHSGHYIQMKTYLDGTLVAQTQRYFTKLGNFECSTFHQSMMNHQWSVWGEYSIAKIFVQLSAVL